MEKVLKIKKDRKRKRAEDKTGIKNNYKKHKSKDRKKDVIKKMIDQEDTLDNNAEATEEEKEATDNNDNTASINKDELVEVTPEDRRKIVNEQMYIIEEDNEFAPVNDSDGCNTEDEIEEHVCQQLTNDDRAEDMTLAKATAYKKELLKKRKRETEIKIKKFKQIPFIMNFQPKRSQKRRK